jgi:hypothetical protein
MADAQQSTSNALPPSHPPQPRKKAQPWWRQTPSLVGLLAFIFSVTTGIYTLLHQHQEDIRSKKEEVRKLVGDIIDVRAEFNQKIAAGTSLTSQQRDLLGSSLNNKLFCLMESADNLVQQIPSFVSSNEYETLAMEKQFAGNSQKAQEYLLAAVGVCREPTYKIVALRGLGMFYASRGSLHDMQKARQYFAEACSALKEPYDDAANYSLGYTCQAWGVSEIYDGNLDEGTKKAQAAENYFNNMSPMNPTRGYALEALRLTVQQLLQNAGVSPSPTPNQSPPSL